MNTLTKILTLAPELLVGVLAVAMCLFAVEFVKPWLKIVVAGRGWSTTLQDAVLRSLVYIFALPTCLVLDFHGNLKSLIDPFIGWEPTFWASVPIGTILTGGLAQLTYHLITRLQVVKTLQLRWQRLNGITQEELDAIRTTRGTAPITPEDVERDRIARGLDDDER